jgi:site-specific recombinase XerD
VSTDRFYLTKRKNGFYYVGARISKTCIRWRTTKCRKKPDALNFMKTFAFALTDEAEEKSHLTLSELLNHYIEQQKHALRAGSLENNVKAVKAFMKMFGDRMPSLYTLSEVEEFKNSYLNRGVSKTTANLNFRGCRTVFNFAVKHEYLDKNIFTKSSQFKIEQKRPVFLSTDDFHKLMSVVEEPVLKDIYLFATLTGLRLNEITNLRWSSVDFNKNQLTLDNTAEFITKSGKIRTVPLHFEIVKMLQSLHSKRRSDIGYVFCKSSGYKFDGSYVSHKFKEYVRLAGLNDELHFHSLRHTCASHLVSNGVSLYVVQNILGHANVSTTMIYSHLSPSSLQDSINKISI